MSGMDGNVTAPRVSDVVAQSPDMCTSLYKAVGGVGDGGGDGVVCDSAATQQPTRRGRCNQEQQTTLRMASTSEISTTQTEHLLYRQHNLCRNPTQTKSNCIEPMFTYPADRLLRLAEDCLLFDQCGNIAGPISHSHGKG